MRPTAALCVTGEIAMEILLMVIAVDSSVLGLALVALYLLNRSVERTNH